MSAGGRGSPPLAAFKVSGNLVFAGNGYIVNKTKLNPYEGLDVKGKIVVIAGLPPELAAQQAAAAARGGRPGGGGATNPLGQNCVDFMTPENSYPVNFARVALAEDIDPYPRGAVWADPDVVHAGEQMRRVFDRRDEAAEKGRRAWAEVREVLSPEAAGRRMAARLEEIRRGRR